MRGFGASGQEGKARHHRTTAVLKSYPPGLQSGLVSLPDRSMSLELAWPFMRSLCTQRCVLCIRS